MRYRATAPGWWFHVPWMTGLALAPLLHGSVNPELQAVIGALFGINLLLLSFHAGEGELPLIPGWLRWSLVAWLLLPLVPLPSGLVQVVSPQRAALELAFPVEAPRSWICMALSPADSAQRLWEIGMMIAVFALARHAAHESSTSRGVAFAVFVALVLLAGSDVLYRVTGREKLLGIWETTWGKGAGTFANRNHFANWLVVGGLFVFGWWLRSVQPLHSARPEGRGSVPRDKVLGAVLAASLLFALVMSVLSASRGASVALVAGGIAWFALVVHRSRSKRRRWLLSLAVLGGVVLLLVSGDYLLDRLAQAKVDLVARYPRVEFWRQSCALALQFPLAGVGVGGFRKAFGHFKTDWGDSTIWHAENDWVQTLLETGIPATLLMAMGLWMVLRTIVRHLWTARCHEPELLMGAFAALIAFGTHACVEFVLQIPGTAILAAALLGVLVGGCDLAGAVSARPPPPRRRVVLNLVAGLALSATALAQGMAWRHWNDAAQASPVRAPAVRAALVEESIAWWPFAPKRYLGLARLGVETLATESARTRAAAADVVRKNLNRGIRLDPLNWELRLERAWLDLAYFRATPRPRVSVWQAVQINPLQPAIPLQFADALAQRDPAWALELLTAVNRSQPANLAQVLEIALRLPGGAAECLKLTPDQVPCLVNLAQFALAHNLKDLALAALVKLKGRMETLTLAKLYLSAGSAEGVLSLLPEPMHQPAERLVAARAHLLAERYGEATRLAESVWQASRFRKEIELAPPVTGSVESLRDAWNDSPKDSKRAADFAEKLAEASRPDTVMLRRLVELFPSNLRLRWLLFQSERVARHDKEAAAAAVALADLVLDR